MQHEAIQPAVQADGVDEIQRAWQRERPGVPVASIGVITRIWRIARLLDDDRRATMRRLGMDVPTRSLLSTLRRAGEPYSLTASELARRAGVTPAAVSQWVSRAEADHLVHRRRRTDGDTRQVDITLTARGRDRIDAVVWDLLQHEDDLVAGLSPTEIDELSDLLRRLLASLTARRSGGGRVTPDADADLPDG